MDLVERIRYIMKLNQLSTSSFADEIGVQRSSISHVLSGRNKPSLDFVKKIIIRFPKVDAAWLINGTTNIIPKEEKISFQENHNRQNIESEEKPNSSESIKEQDANDAKLNSSKDKSISRILIFYTDNSFEEYKPSSSSSQSKASFSES